MDLIKEVLSKTRPNTIVNEATFSAIRDTFDQYACKNIPIKQCLSQTGPQTAELIVNQIYKGKISDQAYDTITILITNYYALLYVIGIHTDDYAIHEKATLEQISAIMDEVLCDTMEVNWLKDTEYSDAIKKSNEFTQQFVTVYFKAGADGCLRYLVYSIYSILRYADRDSALKRAKIFQIIRQIRANNVLNIT